MPNSLITLSIPLNSPVNFVKNIGDRIKEGDEIALLSRSDDQVEIDLQGCFLIKNIGENVEKDEIIATKKTGFIVKKQTNVKSHLAGKIFELDNFSGKVKIKSITKPTSVKSPVSGTIKGEENNKIVLEFKGEEIKLKKAAGKNFFADILLMGDFKDEVDSAAIGQDCFGKILVGGHFSLSDLNKAMAVGAKGVIAAKISTDNLERFKNEKELKMANNVQKMLLSVGLANEDGFAKLSRLAGKKVYFDAEGARIVIPE